MTLKGNTIYAATSVNGVYLSTNNGNNWIYSGLYGNWIETISSNNQNIFAASISDGIFRSTDNGLTWEQKNNGISSTAIVSIKAYNNCIIAASNYGYVYVSTDEGESWYELNDGFWINTAILHINANATNIFTGRCFAGVWSRPISNILKSNYYFENDNKINIFPNPAIKRLKIETNERFLSYTITNLIGQNILNFSLISNDEIDITNLQSGVYFLHIIGNRTNRIEKFIKE
jgi:hypothetical protein